MAEKLEAKSVVPLQEAQQAVANPEPVAPKKVWRFGKGMHGGELLKLSDGREISFHVRVDTNTGMISGSGTFETEDETLANLVRELAVKQPWTLVVEDTE